ncbi:hypothetical protein KI811_06300 [Geobacter hydrogenophilus]|nr:hypothetical protein [Geobacter hydrogenophilus]MBT0893416.1 hypothetical protein [Geobacter hydrogenophilus]
MIFIDEKTSFLSGPDSIAGGATRLQCRSKPPEKMIVTNRPEMLQN